MQSLQGHLLVASPHLPDPNFYRSVVLIIEHHEEAAIGLILNRTSLSPLREVWQQISESPCSSDQNIGVGGPVDGPLMCIHAHPEFADHEITSGIFFASRRDELEHIVGQTEYPFRVFSGYSGWGAGQLDQELRVGGWLTVPAKCCHVFESDESTLWQRVTHTIGREITHSALRIRHQPEDASWN